MHFTCSECKGEVVKRGKLLVCTKCNRSTLLPFGRIKIEQEEVDLNEEQVKYLRRIEFGRFAEVNRTKRGEGKPETFDFLGFTHISGKDRNGNYALKRKSISKRMRAKLLEIKQQLRSSPW